MSTSHILEYSKSSKARCNGPPPCQGTNIDLGVLRYGEVSFGSYGETVKWRHWGCVTPAILQQLAILNLERIPGFRSLRPADQAKIRTALARKRVDPADVPDTAKNLNLSQSQVPPPTNAGNKRKSDALSHSQAGPSSSQTRVPSSSQSSGTAANRSVLSAMDNSQVIEIDDDDDEEEAKDELYCMMTTKIVGVQYYKGLVGPGEEVSLVREPHNKYDRNAIQVKNIGGVQVGHIPREVASRLAPLLDQRLVSVEGVIHDGNLTGFTYAISMTLKFYGPSDQHALLEPKLIWVTPGQRGFPPMRPDGVRIIPGAPTNARAAAAAVPSASQAVAGPSSTQAARTSGLTAEQAKRQREAQAAQAEALRKAAELRQMLGTLEKVDDEGRRSSLLDKLCSTDDVLNLPEHPNPPGVASGELMVDLLKHQRQGLQWCIDREYPVLPAKDSGKAVQFWEVKKHPRNPSQAYYFNLATKTPQEAQPLLGRGALCADSMGLGKTLTMLALILATKSDIPPDFSRSTLIVVPLSVMSNWESQIKEHCTRDALSFCIYYGAGRSMTPDQLKKYDVVITTYQIVTKEHADAAPRIDLGASQAPAKKQKKAEKGLFNVEWKRIILDEGHTIRNPRTKMAKAVCALSAQRRWVLSGTPIINSPRDLGSMLTFLRICRPLDNEDYFKRLLLRPLKDGDPSGAELLKALMSQICIRRTKEMQDSKGNHLVPLPPVEMTVMPVQLDPKTRELYDAIEELSKDRVENYMVAHGGTRVPPSVLGMLTRLRQIALHPGLIPANYLEQLREGGEDDAARPVVQLSPQEKLRLQSVLAQGIEDNEECPICFGILMEPRITTCAHMFCLPCITEVISRDPKCPMDRRQITMADLLEPPPQLDMTQAPVKAEDDEDDEYNELRTGSSAKIDQLVHLLQLTPSNEKSLVFSQFTSFLDKIAETLQQEGIPFVRFDGQMSAKRRQETLERFSVPLQDDLDQSQSQSAAPPAPAPSMTQKRKRSSRVIIDDEENLENSDDGEFVENGGHESDDSFLDDDDDDDSVWTKKKGKSKGKAKGKGKKAAKTSFPKGSFAASMFDGVNPKVMLISLKCGALGLNLTVANNVFLMDPWWQEGIESQAIDRCNRIGQKKPVHVYQLIAENTVESKVLDIQEKKKALIQQAFSGMKSTETQRQKKEARLQDLIELFGIRQRAATQTQRQSTLDNLMTGN